MKKTAISLLLVLALVLCVVLVTAPTTHAEEFSHTSSSGHEGWTALTGGGAKDPGKYYFSGDIDGLTAQLKFEKAGEYTLCLNGKTVDAKKARRILLINHADAIVNICDCAGSGELCNGGGTSVDRGGIIYLQNGTLNIYGGTITGGDATQRGGNICSLNGNLNVYGGAITNGVDPLGANIYFSNSGKLNGKKNLDQLDAAVNAEKVTIDGAVLMARYDNDVDGGTNKHIFKLYSDMNEATPVSVDIGKALQAQMAIDLNGYDLNASFKNTQSGTTNHYVYVTDSTTDDFVCGNDDYGILTYEVAEGFENRITMKNLGDNNGAVTPTKYRYVAIPEGNGYSFHRIYVGFETLSLEKQDDGSVGMGYTTAFKADAKVKAALAADAEVFGIKIGMNDDKGTAEDASDDDYIVGNDLPKTFGKAADAFVAGGTANQVTLRVNKILSSESTSGVTMDVRAQSFVKLSIGGNDVTITSKPYVCSLQDVIDGLYDPANQEMVNQNPAIADLLEHIETTYGIVATA